MGVVPVRRGLVVVGGLLIAVALLLIAIAERLLGVCKRLIRVAQTLVSHIWAFLPIRAGAVHRLLTHVADRATEEPTVGKLGCRPRGR